VQELLKDKNSNKPFFFFFFLSKNNNNKNNTMSASEGSEDERERIEHENEAFRNLIPDVDDLDQWLNNGVDDGPYFSTDPIVREQETTFIQVVGADGQMEQLSIGSKAPTARQWWFRARSTHGTNKPLAVQYYKKVIDLEPRCKAAYIHASILMANAGDYAGSYEVVKKALKFKPTDIDFLWRAARDSLSLRDYSAIEPLRESYELWRAESGLEDADFLGYTANAMAERGDPLERFRPLLIRAGEIAATETQRTHEDWAALAGLKKPPAGMKPALDLGAMMGRKRASGQKKAAAMVVEKVVVDKEAAERAERELLEAEEAEGKKGAGKKKGKAKK
jgi:hypothetical protein